MGTPHINAEVGDFAKVVLMPGDPLRAKWICDTFLTEYKEVTNLRGMLGFTGLTKNGVRISVMASGMGQPSIGIYTYELFSQFEVDTIIRVGTCGSYQKDVHVGDVIVANSASSDANWTDQYELNGGLYSAAPSFEVLERLVNSAREQGKKFHVGNVLSANLFYNADELRWKKWEALGVLAVEMEAYSLFCNAAYLKKKAGCVLTVSDSFYREPELTPAQRQTQLRNMVEIAITAAEKELNASVLG